MPTMLACPHQYFWYSGTLAFCGSWAGEARAKTGCSRTNGHCLFTTGWSKLHRPYLRLLFLYFFPGPTALLKALRLLNVGNVSMGYRYFQFFYVYSNPYLHYFCTHFASPTFIQGPMFILFLKFSRPWGFWVWQPKKQNVLTRAFSG